MTQKKLETYLGSTREQKRMSQEMLASKTGVSINTIEAIEDGRYEPSITLALRISETLQEDVSNVFRLRA